MNHRVDTISPCSYFSTRYSEARGKFLAAAASRGLDTQPCLHPGRGRDGETLALDSVLQTAGPGAPLLIISSGCHGVEGFCGSALQTAVLYDKVTQALLRETNVAILYLHALNPHGFSWWRRVTHENVDLNRNFVDFRCELPTNPGYHALAPLLLPRDWPPSLSNHLRLLGFIACHGMRAAQAALSSGQYDDPNGLFFGGTEQTWSQRTLRQLLRTHSRGRDRLAWLDIHTGLGPSGVAEPILAARADAATLARARKWWGNRVVVPLQGESSSAHVLGEMWQAAYDECPDAEYTGLIVEYGTVSRLRVMNALRGDHWLWLNRHAPARLRTRIERGMLEAFNVNTRKWRRQVIEQGLDLVRSTIIGLAGAKCDGMDVGRLQPSID
jgi:Protein of unknown function (DUF2817)